MNTFLAFMYFALVASAAANQGYNYQQPKQPFKPNYRPSGPVGNGGIFSPQQAPPLPSYNIQGSGPNFGSQQIDLTGPAGQYGQSQYNGGAQQYASNAQQYAFNSQQYAPNAQQFAVPQSQYLGPIQQPALSAPSAPSGSSSQSLYQAQQQTIISKDIYIHSAPEEPEEVINNNNPEVGPIRKNYRIVFIKAPSQNIRFNADSFKRTQAANEEKTIIYVLSKKPDFTHIQSQLSTVQNDQKANKPEVYFIKYKTQEEANRAQKEIQAQYDALGGSTSISDEGIAPITSVIGGGPVNIGGGSVNIGGGSANIGSGLSFASSSSFGQSSNGIQQQQQFSQSFNGNQASSSSVSFSAQVPNNKYLPVKKK